jgi:DNA-binding transcriptional LysR family regulator
MKNDLFDLRLLTVFDALMAESNVTHAAARLHLTQSAVSQSLAKLRAALGDPLFVRTGHVMEPTAKARAMAGPIRQALETINATLDTSLAFDSTRSRRSFRIATTDYGLIVLLPKLARSVSEHSRDIELIFSSVQLNRGAELIREGSIDLLIAYFVVTKMPGNFRTRQLFRDSFVVLARKGHPRFRSGMTLQAFAEAEHIVVAPRDTWLPGPLDLALAKIRLRRNIRILVPSYMLVPHVVAGSDLIATLPERAVAHVKGKLPIDVFPMPMELPALRVEMAWDERHHHDPAHKWLRGLLGEICKTL